MKKIILTVSVFYFLATGMAVSAHSQYMKSTSYNHNVTSATAEDSFAGRTRVAVKNVLPDDGRDIEAAMSNYSLNGNSCVPY